MTYAYQWWDDARLSLITRDADTGSGSNPLHTSTFSYDVNGRVKTVSIDDDRDRTVSFVTDANGQVLRRTETDNVPAYEDPRDAYVYFNGQRIGEVTNDTEYVSTYVGTMWGRAQGGPSVPTPFRNGNFAQHGVDFDLAYEALTPHAIRSGGTSWTVRDGDSLQGIAAATWGDASLWWMIAEANGLTSASLLAAGQTLVVPAKVGNVHNTSQTFRPYDPNKALGDLNPTQVKPATNAGGGCGVIGRVLMAAVAVAVTALTQGALSGATSGLLNLIGSSAAATGATAAAAGAAASQAVGAAIGVQDSFDWKGVGLAALSGGISGGLSASGAFQGLPGGAAVQGAARAATANVLTQGVATAAGLQHRFDWTGVAVAGVVGGVGARVNAQAPAQASRSERELIVGLASGLAGAATRSLIDGSSFGDNILSVLPDVIGQTIGGAVAGSLKAAQANRNLSALKTGVGGKGPPIRMLESGAYQVGLSDGAVLTGSPEELTLAILARAPRGVASEAPSTPALGAGVTVLEYGASQMYLQEGGQGVTFQSFIGLAVDDGPQAAWGMIGEYLNEYGVAASAQHLMNEMAPYGGFVRDFASFVGMGALMTPDTERANLLGELSQDLWMRSVSNDIVVTGHRPWTMGRAFETGLDYFGVGLMGILNGGVVQPVMGAAKFVGTTAMTGWDASVSLFGNGQQQQAAQHRLGLRWRTAQNNAAEIGMFTLRVATDVDGSYRRELASDAFRAVGERWGADGPMGLFNAATDITSVGTAFIPLGAASAPGRAQNLVRLGQGGVRIAAEGAPILGQGVSPLLTQIREAGGTLAIQRGQVGALDIAAASRASGNEIALFRDRATGQRYLRELGGIGGQIPENSRLILHTQPGAGPMAVRPSLADRLAIDSLRQRSSVIINSEGTYVMRFRNASARDGDVFPIRGN